MRKTHTETKHVVVLDDILCNQCGKSCKDKDGWNYVGLIEAEVSGGFGSKVLGDMNQYTFSICEECLGTMFKSFAIAPDTSAQREDQQ